MKRELKLVKANSLQSLVGANIAKPIPMKRELKLVPEV